MAVNPFEMYVVMAPMAAAFAGFGSLASGLGSRPDADEAKVDATRLTLMLFASLSATFLGLLPVTLAGILLNEELAVRLSAAAGVALLLGYCAIGLKRAVALRGTAGFSRIGVSSNLACAILAMVCFAISLAAFPKDRGPAVYLGGLMSLLGSSGIMFSLVIVSMLRRHDA